MIARHLIPATTIGVHRADAQTSIISLQGEITTKTENALMDAYTQATTAGAQAIILNFAGLKNMDSSGISLLIMLLVRVKRQRQRLLVSDLNERYCKVLKLVGLSQAIGIYETESQALTALAAVKEFNLGRIAG